MIACFLKQQNAIISLRDTKNLKGWFAAKPRFVRLTIQGKDMTHRTFIFDYDSTFIQCESFDELIRYVAEKEGKGPKIAQDVARITELAMDGQTSFQESLSYRSTLLPLHKKDIKTIAQSLKNQISASFLRNKAFFEKHKENIHIISGGFYELIWPVVKTLGLKSENIHANRFLYDYDGNVVGFDKSRPTSLDQGKVIQVQQLKLEGDVIVIGDGYNDYEIKAAGAASTFFAYNENVQREHVNKVADGIFADLEGIFMALNIEVAKTPKPKKALLLENIHPVAVQLLKSQGYQIEALKQALTGPELMQALKGVHLLGIRSKTHVTQDILEHAENLETIGAFCIGTNQIDLKQCTKQGIAVFNAPFSNTRSVVEMAMCEIIMLMRNLGDKSMKMHQTQWEKTANNAYEVRGKTLGIIGYGNIGSQLSILAENFGMHVLYYDMAEKLPLGNAKACDTMEDCLKQSDVISLHVDGRPSNKLLIDEKAIQSMKPGGYLINLSRGSVVDLKALKQAIDAKHLLGAAIDVFPEEPESNQAGFTHPLQGTPNVILTPHIGGSTSEAQENIGQFVSNRLHDYARLGATVNSVNMPELQLPPIQGSHRIIHIHENVPGILAQINQLFAKYEANIEGQYLKTNEDIGYVITDINVINGHAYREALEKIPHTIRVRVLY